MVTLRTTRPVSTAVTTTATVPSVHSGYATVRVSSAVRSRTPEAAVAPPYHQMTDWSSSVTSTLAHHLPTGPAGPARLARHTSRTTRYGTTRLATGTNHPPTTHQGAHPGVPPRRSASRRAWYSQAMTAATATSRQRAHHQPTTLVGSVRRSSRSSSMTYASQAGGTSAPPWVTTVIRSS